MATDKSVLSLDIVNNISDNDTVLAVISSQLKRLKWSSLLSRVNQWDNIHDKPFDDYNTDVFSIEVNSGNGASKLTLSPNIRNQIHTHGNKNVLDKISESNKGGLLYNGEEITSSGTSEWENINDKPFDTVSSDDFEVVNNVLSISDAFKNSLYNPENSDVLNKFSESNGKVLYDGNEISGGFDFSSLSAALTGGILSGIEITPNTISETFNITVTGIPEITINSDGYWCINDISTNRKAQGEKGADGTTPHIDSITHNWYIGDNDTGILAEGTNGTNSYIHIKYSANEPTQNSDMKDTADTWIGVYYGISESAPSEYSAYQWQKIKGEDGVTTVTSSAINFTGTLFADDWSDTAPYTQAITVNGLTDSQPILDIVLSDDIDTAKQEESQWGYISKASTATNSLTVICFNKKPTVDLNIQIKVV